MLRCREPQLPGGGAGPPDNTRPTRQNEYCTPVQHPESRLESNPAATTPDPPRATAAAIQHATDGRSANMGDPNSDWAPGRPIPSKRATRQHHPVLQCSIPRARLKSKSCHRRSRSPISRRQRTRRSARRGWAGPRLRSGGRRASDARELLIVTILQSSAVSRGGHDLQADFVRLADRCFGPCGTAVRRLPGTPVGDTPIYVGFRGARRKRSAVDAETWLNALSPSSNFEYLVIPHHHSGQLN